MGDGSEDDQWTEVRRPQLRKTTAGKTGGKAGGKASRSSGGATSSRSRCGQSWTSQWSRQEQEEAERKVFVQGLTLATKDSTLRRALQNFGDVVEARICREQDATSKGFGFVTFSDSAAAERALREDSVRIDGKLCAVKSYSLDARSSGKGSGGSGVNDKGLTPEEQSCIDYFVRAHELPPHCRDAFVRSGGKTARRVIKGLEAYRSQISESLVMSELAKSSRSYLSKKDEERIQELVQKCGLPEEEQSRIEGLLLSQRPEEIEYIVSIGNSSWFRNELWRKKDPTHWILGQLNKWRKSRNAEDVQVFCDRFGFTDEIKHQLMELSVSNCRRLMQRWQPAGPGTHFQRQEDFVYQLRSAIDEKRIFLENRERSQTANTANHEKIMEEWSDDEEFEEQTGNADTWTNPNADATDGRTAHRQSRDFEAFDGGTSLLEATRTHEQFCIHSPMVSAQTSGRGRVHTSGSSTGRGRRFVPKPTHFVFCVDTSGSMILKDCQGPDGMISRILAVKKTCHDIITVMALNGQDIFSFVTFNKQATLHFAGLCPFSAVEAINAMEPQANEQTMFSVGIKGIQAALNRDERKLPAHAIFLSDGEPSDPDTYLDAFHKLMRNQKSDLKVYAVGFGNPIKAKFEENEFAYLQQLASLGRGHFQHCSASVESLQGAFTALTSTISRTRDSNSRKSGRSSSSGKQQSESVALPTSKMSSASLEPVQASSSASSSYPAPPDNLASRTQMTGAKWLEANPMEQIDEEEDSIGSSLEEFEDDVDNAEASRADPAKSVVFELPQMSNIFKDPYNTTYWSTFLAARTTFTFDGKTFSKGASVEQVYLRKKPFIQGGMRLVYGMLMEAGVKTPQNPDSRMCAKRTFNDLKKDRGFVAHSDFCRCTAVADYYAKMFRAEMKKVDKSVGKFGFLECQLFSPIDKGAGGFHFCGEQFLSGNYVKLNSNAGYVNQAEYSDHSQVAQAFSHFTFDRSHGHLMVVDLQGICGRDKDNKIYFVLTDPQVHSRGEHERFGQGDFQDEGVRMFFHKHKCGELCAKLHLKKEYDLCEPNLLFPMPCFKDCISFLLGVHQPTIWAARHKYKVSSITIPREPTGNWGSIRVWGDKRGLGKMKDKLQEILEQWYSMARYQVKVEGHIPWDVTRWREKVEAWNRDCGLCVLLYPPDWQDLKAVQEIWVFSTWRGIEKGYDHTDSHAATTTIREELAKAYVAAPNNTSSSTTTTVSSGAAMDDLPVACSVEEQHLRENQESDWAAEAGPPQRWSRYQSHGKRYWYREPDGMWFWEDSREWTRYVDDKGLHWWFNDINGEWFYEPS